MTFPLTEYVALNLESRRLLGKSRKLQSLLIPEGDFMHLGMFSIRSRSHL